MEHKQYLQHRLLGLIERIDQLPTNEKTEKACVLLLTSVWDIEEILEELENGTVKI